MSKESVRFFAGLILSVMASGAGIITYAFTTFETKEHIQNDIAKRLDRIEDKLDRALTDRR